MKTKKTSNAELNKKYLSKVSALNSQNKHIDDIYNELLHGKNSYLRMRRLESSVFDSSWIEVVEGVLFDLGEIVSNPRQVTKQESNIVPVELAKKTDGESVQHLASHTQYIKEVDEEGNVIPSKILSHSNEDNLFTYENRFIATFIRRLVLFIEKRYEFIQNMIPLHVEDVLYVKNKSLINGEEVEIETKIKVKRESQDDLAYKAKGFVERIESMREYIFYYYNSPFMRKMKNERDVRKPIIQTNILRKNLKYHHCLEVFTFIEKFESLGVNYHVAEDYKIFNEKELADLNYILLSDYLAVNNESEFEEVKRSQKEYKPKILTSIDDEIFTFGPPLTGTLEFVRVDEPYRNYLNKMQEVHDLPLHPDKYEKLYYKDEYLYKKVYKDHFEEIEKLLRRKVREQENYEVIIQNILKQVAKEEQAAEEARLRAIVEDEYKRIEAKRKEMMELANKEHDLQIQREKERLERMRKAEEERLRKQAEEEERERIRKEQEAERLRQEQLEEERRQEEARIARQVNLANDEIKNRVNEILENRRIEKEVDAAKVSIREQEIVILNNFLTDRENRRREEEARIDLEVAEAKDAIRKQQVQMLQNRQEQIDSAHEDINEQVKRILEKYNQEKQSQIPQVSSLEDNPVELSDAPASDASSDIPEVAAVANEPEEAPVEEEKPAESEEEKVEEQPEETPAEEAVEEPSEEPVEEEPVSVPELEEEEKKQSNKRRHMKAHVVSINGKKVNAYMYVEGDEEGEEEAPKEAPKKKAPAKKAEPAKKAAPAKKNNSSFPIISKKYEGDRYVLQTSKGYYFSDNNFVMRKKDAKLFDSKESAEAKRAQFGGKVVKL